MSNAAKNFDTSVTNLSIRHNYFDSSTKLLFSDLRPVKILGLSTKPYCMSLNKNCLNCIMQDKSKFKLLKVNVFLESFLLEGKYL